MTIRINPEILRILRHGILGTVSVLIVNLNEDIPVGGGFTNLTAYYQSRNRCRNIRTMQNMTNTNLIDPNKSWT